MFNFDRQFKMLKWIVYCLQIYPAVVVGLYAKQLSIDNGVAEQCCAYLQNGVWMS